MPSQPFPASWLAGLTGRHSLPAPTANNHDAAAYEEREAPAGWRIISAQVLKKQLVQVGLTADFGWCREIFFEKQLVQIVLTADFGWCHEILFDKQLVHFVLTVDFGWCHEYIFFNS